MSDIKEVDIRFKLGDFVNDTPGIFGQISLLTGAEEANKVWGELQGKYGEDFDSKPVCIIPSENAEGLKEFLEGFEGFDSEGGPSKEEIAGIKEGFLKPAFKRVGDDVVITREEPIEEIAPFLEGFTDVLDGDSSFTLTMEADKTASEIHGGKNLLFSFHNGVRGSLSLRLSLALMERAFDMGTQFAPVPEPELAKTMLNVFKRYSLNFETFDVESLPDELKEVFSHPMLEKLFNPFREEVLGEIKEHLLPILKQCESFSSINGPIKVYFPIKDTLVLKIEANAPGWFDSVNELLENA